ncbi:MAG: cytochrome c biogenesis protein ResB [Planctomycetes bacterium]|nr:cytochrome c biogenesis protein ResB [Planctomycetota bacterium]
MHPIRSALRVAGSLWFAAVLLVLLMVAMGSATVFEQRHGSERALAEFYRAAWFRVLLVLVAVNAAAALAACWPFHRRQIGFLLTHGGILVVLAGTLATRHFAVQGQVVIAEGETAEALVTADPVLAIEDVSRGRTARIMLDPGVFTGFRAVVSPVSVPLELGPIRRVEVLRYLPARVGPQADARAAAGPAVEVRLIADAESPGVWLRKHEPRRLEVAGAQLELRFENRTVPLGFELELRQFRIGYYPGRTRPRSFESHVTVRDRGADLVADRVIRMNHPLSHGGYTFYQSSYRETPTGNVNFLSVSRDPGQPIVFAGYLLTILGLLWVLVLRMRDPARAARH